MYAHNAIDINGRSVQLSDIRGKKAEIKSPFESEVYDFLRSWINGTEEFTTFTSGSTGDPQPFRFTRSQMESSARLTLDTLAIPSNTVALVCINPRYIGGKMMLVRALVNNMKIACLEPSGLDVAAINDMPGISLSAMVPLQLARVLDQGGDRVINHIDTILIGGAPLPHTLNKQLAGVKTRVYETFGMTETLSHIALRRVNGQEVSTCFSALRGVSIDQDSEGQLVISTPYLTSPVHTRDRVQLVGPGNFEWLGRTDFVINSGGMKMHPEELERRLRATELGMKLGREIMISGLPDAILGERITVLVEGEPLSDHLLEQLNEVFFQIFSKYEIPKEVIFITQIDRLASGKFNRYSAKKAAIMLSKLT